MYKHIVIRSQKEGYKRRMTEVLSKVQVVWQFGMVLMRD